MTTKLNNPTIETITAEISIVRIGNKQMTISVFNQLYEEKCWDEYYNVIYPVWGKTNREREYIIFQKDNELRKCELPKKIKMRNYGLFFWDFVSENKDEIHSIIPTNKKDWLGKNSVYYLFLLCDSNSYDNRFRIHEFTSYVPLAEPAVPENILKSLKANYEEYVSFIASNHNMIDYFNNQRQLFIAV